MRTWALSVVLAFIGGSAIAAPSARSAAVGGVRTAHLLDMAVPPRLTISETGSPPPTDPHAGSLVAGEVALGAVFVLGVDALSILAGFGLFYALLAAGEGGVGLA